MSNHDSELLSIISKQCFFRIQPQPLVDLLNKRGVLGRHAEVFWTYFHWGFQSGSFSCQISSAHIAEMLFTDIRTVQRANERLQEAGLITRVRAVKAHGAHHEAPATTTITIPDEDARMMLTEAPQRGTKRSVPAISTFGSSKEFTKVNSPQIKPVSHDECPAPSPTPDPSITPPPKAPSKIVGELAGVKAGLPEKVQRLHDVCMVKASPGMFRRVLDELGGVSDHDSEVLMRPLVEALRLKQKEVNNAQKRNPPAQHKSPETTPVPRSKKRPQDPRPIPVTVVSFIKQRLYNTKANKSIGNLAHEIIYSITVGTMRGVDVMHAINATIKLISTKQWTRPRGMPQDWSFDHVLVGTA